MLVEWERCAVADRAGFDHGQRSWGGLRDLPGFLGRFGGWSGRGTAHVFSFWADRLAHDRFSAGFREVFAAGQEPGRVLLFERRADIGSPLPDTSGAGAAHLRHRRVAPERAERAAAVLDAVWVPGTAVAPGLLGGVVARRSAEFLVLTRWSSALAHARYRAERFPVLLGQAGDDPAEEEADLVDVEPGWEVAPPRS
ncbi:DUF4937 domain-containing protein [Saccharopolyspora sp. CA-218241]|uniref:DUF4937 domain-containing protein n=1 Tax=Saccharopolyspora sp. CA-218241 TaxID=3240027 RepID=UPI003D993B26